MNINVTKTFLPPINEYNAILHKAWKLGWITNRGLLVKELEKKIKKYLNCTNILATTNGTLPLQISIKVLKLKGEIITTPFSYVATTSSIVWEGCKPVFVDINPKYLTIDETKIEKSITPKTCAILATHVFGNPCNVDSIYKIAKKYNLKIIYDAAHAFGVNYKDQSIFNYGDISTCSFHSTKIFHTGEGGALFTSNKKILNELFYHHNFGHKGKEDFYGLGINAKMSELHAALGLTILPYIDEIINCRKKIANIYRDKLHCLSTIEIRKNTDWNYSYFPVIFNTEKELVRVMKALNNRNIFPRRYFYPSLDTLPYIKSHPCQLSQEISSKILCLPIYKELLPKEVELISKIIKNEI